MSNLLESIVVALPVLFILIPLCLTMVLVSALYYFRKKYNKYYNEKLKELSERINKMPHIEKEGYNWQYVCEDLVDLLDFDYSVLSLIDFKSQKIESRYYSLKRDKEEKINRYFLDSENLTSWVENRDSEYILDHDKDILLDTINSNKSKILIANKLFNEEDLHKVNFFTIICSFAKIVLNIFFPKKNSFDEPDFVNSYIYKKYHHEELCRIYLPICYLNSRDSFIVSDFDSTINEMMENNELFAENFPIGVLELGVKNCFFFSNSKNTLFEPNSLLLNNFIISFILNSNRTHILPLTISIYNSIHIAKIYADNIGQVYFEKEKERQASELLLSLENIRFLGDNDYEKYAKELLSKVSDYLGASIGLIAFRNFDVDYLSYRERAIYNIELTNEHFHDLDENIAHKGISSAVIATGVPYLMSRRVNPYYVDVFKNNPQKSEIIAPIILDGYIMGVISFLSTTAGVFNLITVSLIEKVTSEFTLYFFRKKNYKILSEFSKPDAVWDDKKTIIERVGRLLESFYSSNYIIIWEAILPNPKGNNKLVISPMFTSKGFYIDSGIIETLSTQIKSDNRFLRLIFEETKKLSFLPVYNLSSTTRTYDSYIFDLFTIKSYVILKIEGVNGTKILISINSKRSLHEKGSKFYDYFERDKDFLIAITNRLQLSIQNQNVLLATNNFFNAFNKITEATKKKDISKDILKFIVDAAKQGVNASIVSLYLRKFPEDELFTINGIHSTTMRDLKLTRRNSKALTANAILQSRDNTKVYSFWNKDTYLNFLMQKTNLTRVSKKSFWTLNKINSAFAYKIYDLNDDSNDPIGVLFFNFTNINHDVDVNNNIEYQTLGILMDNFVKMIQIVLHTYREIEINVDNLMAQQRKLNSNVEELNSQKKEVEKKLEMLLPQAAKSTFYLILEAVNHDVRNLLLGLESIIHDIQAKTYLKGVDKSHFDFLADRVSFINFSITKLLSLFNFNNQRVQLVDLNRIIKDTSQYFETIRGEDSKKIEFINKLSKSIVEVMCVKTEMTMIVYNLFINAVQAIELSSNNRGVLEFFTGIEGDNIVFRIKDNGIGIKDKDIPYIFDAHFSTKNGLGIGLYFVKSLIESEEYNGQITVKSENTFTTFQVSIPSYINFRK